jgi:hypothetical protein
MILRNHVVKKLKEFGIPIYNKYDIKSNNKNNEDEYVLYSENMILFINDIEKYIGVTFQATTKPERAATLILILAQIKGSEIHIMEPFVFNENHEFISGDQAYNLISETDREQAFNEYTKKQAYTEMLLSAKKFHEC